MKGVTGLLPFAQKFYLTLNSRFLFENDVKVLKCIHHVLPSYQLLRNERLRILVHFNSEGKWGGKIFLRGGLPFQNDSPIMPTHITYNRRQLMLIKTYKSEEL
jgi:hypothetical protein